MPSTSGFGGIVFSIPPLGKLLGQIQEEKKEEKKEEQNIDNKAPAVADVEKNNPPKVEDKTEAGDLPKKKEMKPSDAPKLESDKVKYTKLSNFVPVEYKRGECEAPKLTGEEIDEEELTEWEEGEEEVDEKVSKTHMNETSPPRRVAKSGTAVQDPMDKKWRAIWNQSGKQRTKVFSDQESAQKHAQDMHARHNSTNEAGLKPRGYGAPGERKGTNKPARKAEKKRQRRQGKEQTTEAAPVGPQKTQKQKPQRTINTHGPEQDRKDRDQDDYEADPSNYGMDEQSFNYYSPPQPSSATMKARRGAERDYNPDDDDSRFPSQAQKDASTDGTLMHRGKKWVRRKQPDTGTDFWMTAESGDTAQIPRLSELTPELDKKERPFPLVVPGDKEKYGPEVRKIANARVKRYSENDDIPEWPERKTTDGGKGSVTRIPPEKRAEYEKDVMAKGNAAAKRLAQKTRRP